MHPQASTIIKLATSMVKIEQCFPIMSNLRTDFNQSQFVQQVQAQIAGGYQLAYLKNVQVMGVAGFKIDISLSWGKHLYLADLVVAENQRSQGYGTALFNWLIDLAKQHNCQQFHLDSGVQRFDAHRFYLQQKMYISSHHFTLKL